VDEEQTALALYQALRAHGEAMSGPELRKAAGLDTDQAEPGLRRLRRLGLIREDRDQLEPVEPDAALITTMTAYEARIAEQAGSATAFRQLADSLLTVYRPAVAREASQVEVEYITGPQQKKRSTAMLMATTQECIDSMHPGPMPPMDLLEQSLRHDAAMIKRGIRLRCLYPQSLLQGTRYAPYLRALTALGAEVRIVGHLPTDLIIQDRITAVMSTNPEQTFGHPMLLIRGAALVNTLNTIYEDYWLRAIPYEQAAAPGPGPGSQESELTTQERVVIRLMAGGLSDDQIARKMGISRRTVQRDITKLMDRLHATSRFEAGLKLAQDPHLFGQLRRER